MKLISLRQAFVGLDREAKLRRYRELWHAAGRFEILPDHPLHLDLELSGVCNLSCQDCFQESLDKKRLGLMDEALFQRLVDEGVENGLCAIKLQIRGESFLHPKLFECIEYAKERGVLDVQITTNGTLLDEAAMRRVLDSGLDGIIFSVDPRHADACSSRGAPIEYSQVPSAVNRFLGLRRERGAERPWVRLKAATDEATPEVMEALREEMRSAFPLADIFIVGKIFDYRKDRDSFPDLHRNYVLNPCAYLTQRLAVFWDGQATVCCMDYHGEFGLGTVHERPVGEIWLSAELGALRKAHLGGRRPKLPICGHCHLCVSSANARTFVDESPRSGLDYQLGLAGE